MQQRCPDNKALANPRDPFTSASIGGHSICSNIPCFHVRSREEEERSIGLLSLKIAFLLMNPKKKKENQKKTPKTLVSSNGNFTSSVAKVEKYSDLSTFSSSLWAAVPVGGVSSNLETLFLNLFAILTPLSFSFLFSIMIFERGGVDGRGRAWIPRVGRCVYLPFVWGLVGSNSAKKDALPLEVGEESSKLLRTEVEGSFLVHPLC